MAEITAEHAARLRAQGLDPAHADKFTDSGAGMVLTQCTLCARWVPGSWGCDAFPSSIPVPIRENNFDHRRPYDGDQGMQFEPKPGADRAALGRLYALLDRDAKP